MPGEIVLVVDDNPTNLKLLQFLLSSKGYQVVTAVDAEQALASVAASRPAAALLDLQLPGMDGLSLARALRSEPSTHDLVILAVTAHVKGEEERALAAGCDGFITKPIDTRALPVRLAQLLALRRPP